MWIEKYDELLFRTVNNDEATITATKIKNENMPEIVYKYRTTSDNHVEALRRNILYASAPSCLNDPYEGSLFIDSKKRWKYFYQIFLDIFFQKTGLKLTIKVDEFDDRDSFILELAKCMGIHNHELKSWGSLWSIADVMVEIGHRKFEEEMKAANDEIHRICSFSCVNDSNPMWVHYAADYSGFCVGYNIKELQNNLTDLLLPVRYTDELLEVDDTFFKKGKPNSSFYIDSLTRKSTQWSYEQEWRLLLLAKSTELIQIVELPRPKKVILGKNIKKEDARRIIDIGVCLGTTCYKQVISKSSYACDLVNVTNEELPYYFA